MTMSRKKTLKRTAVLGLDDYKDDDDDKTVAIPSHQGEEIEIRKDLSVVMCAAVLRSVLEPLTRLPHIAECASQKVFHVQFSEQVCTEILFLQHGIRVGIGTMRASYMSK